MTELTQMNTFTLTQWSLRGGKSSMEAFTEQVIGRPIASSSLDSCNAENSQLETTRGIMGVSTSQRVH